MTTREPGAMTEEDRILLVYREAIAEATERAVDQLRSIGVADPVGRLLGRPESRADRREARPSR